MAKERYKILFDVEIDQHLDAIELKYHSLIRSAIERQLRFEASKETRNRKPLLRENELEADWEIRFGPDNRFRVLYTVDEEHHEVVVLAIGVKQGNRLFVAGEELTI